MLTITEEFFRTDQIAEIKQWLAQPGAGLFRRAIQNEMAKLQIEAGAKLMSSMEPDHVRFRLEAETKLWRVKELQQVITEMDRAASKDFQPFVAKVASI